MEARNFKEANVIYAENQDEYQSLPARKEKDDFGAVTLSFSLSEEEIKQVVETGTIYVQVLTFNKPLQPIYPSVLDPFTENGLRHANN